MALAEPILPPSDTHASSLQRPRASTIPGQYVPRCVSELHPLDFVSGLDQTGSPSASSAPRCIRADSNAISYEDVEISKELALLWDTASSFPSDSIDGDKRYSQEVVNSRILQDFDHKPPFHKWMQSLRKWANRRPTVLDQLSNDLDRTPQRDEIVASGRLHPQSRHQKSSSGSSYGFVAAVRSASVSLGGTSVMTRSRRNNIHSRYSRTERSSRASLLGPRISEDGIVMEKPPTLDLAAIKRALQRRRILEELISTEESYIRDIRFLSNVYSSVLASLPALSMRLRQSINKNLAEILDLHDEILGELHRVVPDSELNQHHQNAASHQPLRNPQVLQRGRSLDAIPEYRNGMPLLHDEPGMVSDPQVAAEVAKLFIKKMNRFFIYKEYGAKYELMIHDIVSAPEAMTTWQLNQRGLEILGSGIKGSKTNSEEDKKSRSVADLLVKPIQRVCRYPLLFAELLKHTPEFDCPNSHMEIETALVRLREATAEINRVTNDDEMKVTLAKTWLLQDRLVFPDRKLDAASKSQVRSFGYVQMCGALHVCWLTQGGVTGQYMICLLYKDFLCLACASKVDPIYTLRAIILLDGATVEDVDNGRGIRCHTALFSWKLIFESGRQLYEIIMTAYTSQEATQWRQRLYRPFQQNRESRDPSLNSSLFLNMKSIGPVFRKQVAQRSSIHRALTLGSRPSRPQVILKKTKGDSISPRPSSSTLKLHRSKSLSMTGSNSYILSPSHGERMRLELSTADIWSREILPYPVAPQRTRSEIRRRNSTSTMMRKMSLNRRSSTSQISRSIGAGASLRGLRRAHKKASLESLRCDIEDKSITPDTSEDVAQQEPENPTIPEEEPECSEPEVTEALEKNEKDEHCDVVFIENISEKMVDTPILRVADTNSLGLVPTSRSSKTPSLVGKENSRQLAEHTTGIMNRSWGKGSMRGEAKGHHGIRSLFR